MKAGGRADAQHPASVAARTPQSSIEVEAAIEEFVASCYHDPLRFVRGAYPWREPNGPLADEDGPDAVQEEFLTALGDEVTARAFDGVTPVMPVRMAMTKGHGVGGSALLAWITNWIMSTRPHSDGTITAGGYQQLESRTWPAIQYWTGMCLTAPWFDVMERGIYSKDYPATWKVQMQSCKKQNAQAFAGQHSKRSSSWYGFDEASQIEDLVWETAYGGMTDGEPIIVALGQMTRNSGEFYKVCFGSLAARWNHRRVDSRQSRFTNKELIATQISDYGESSDFVRVRVLGYPPSADELQYIDRARVDAARARVMLPLPDDPLIAGFDVSGGGKAWNVIRFRRGLCGNPLGCDGAPLGPWRLPGEKDPDRGVRIAKCAELLSDTRAGQQIAALFVDAAFGAAIVVQLRSMGFSNVYEVNFGAESHDAHDKNMRATMYRAAKQHCLLGSLPDDDDLCEQLCLPGYKTNPSGKLVIESKENMIKRGAASPDDADAFCLTFARAVKAKKPLVVRSSGGPPRGGRMDWA